MKQNKGRRLYLLLLAVSGICTAVVVFILGIPVQAVVTTPSSSPVLTLVALSRGGDAASSSSATALGNVRFTYLLSGGTYTVDDLAGASFTSTGGIVASSDSLNFTKSDNGYKFTVEGTFDTAHQESARASLTIKNNEVISSITPPYQEKGQAQLNDYTLANPSSGELLTGRITYNTRVNLTLYIQDPNISLAAYERARGNNTLQSALGGDAFYGSTPVYSVGEVADEVEGGVKYTITYKNILFTGKSAELSVRLRYGEYIDRDYPIEMRRLSQTLDGDVAVGVPSSSDLTSTPSMPDPVVSSDEDEDDRVSSTSSYVFVPPPTPSLIVSEYDYGGSSAMAASDVTLRFAFQNTSSRVTIENIVMKIAMPEAFTIKNSANTFYYEKLSPRDKEIHELLFSVKPSAEPISHPIKIAFTYETVVNKERKGYTADVELSVPVEQRSRVTLQPVTVAESFIMEEEENEFEAKFVNMGKSQIYNATLTIIGENLKNSGQSLYLGNVDSGKEAKGEFSITAEEAGPVTGEVVLAYEDASMNVTELRTSFTTEAMSPPEPYIPEDIPADFPLEDDIPQEVPWYKLYPPYYYMVAGVVLLVFLAYGRKLYLSAKEKRLAKLDEDF